MQIDGSTKLVGVFGSPIHHTASPAMHNAAFAALHLNWLYVACPVAPERLQAALQGARDMGFAGINLTVPHKILAIDLMDEVDEEAARMGAVNTVHFRDGRMCGFNTDGYGLAKSLQEDFNLGLSGKAVLVLGAGGAGRGIGVKAGLEGARCVYVANRTLSKIEPIEAELRKLNVPCHPRPLDPEALAEIIDQVDVVINATSIGLSDDQTSPLPGRLLGARHYVYDTIYRPARTRLLEEAAAGGAKTANGLGMLLHQGARALEIWTETKAPVAVMRRALRGVVYGEAS